MGKLFILIGKSASGKDTLLKSVLADCPHLKRMISYTTRPMREGEVDGKDYYFVSDSFFEEKEMTGKVIEERVYSSEHGIWKYGSIDEGENFFGNSYIAIKDPEGARKLKEYYGKENVVIVHVTVDDGIRLMRALTREMAEEKPKYAELCNRFLEDERNFENVVADYEVENDDVTKAVKELKEIIRKARKKGQR